MAEKIKLNPKGSVIKVSQDRAILMICIGIALIFWVLVKLSQTYQSEKSIVLSFRIPQDQSFVQAPPEDMIVEMAGTGWDLLFEFFSSPSIRLEYDLLDRSAMGLSQNQLRSDIQDAFYAKGLQVININYDRLDLILEEKITRSIPIVLQSNIRTAPDHQLRKPPVVNPALVEVTGPISLVSQLDTWPTDSILIRGLKNNVVEEVPLYLPPGEIQINPRSVAVNLQVEQITQKSLFVPLHVVNARDSIQIFPRQIAVTCILGISLYDRINQSDFVFQIDMAKASDDPSDNSLPIELVEQPDSVRNIQSTPKTAKFFIVQDTTLKTLERE